MGEYKSFNQFVLNEGALPSFVQNMLLQCGEAGAAGLCITQEPAVLQGPQSWVLSSRASATFSVP